MDPALERALDRGSSSELHPSVPPGFMGEVAPDMRKADDFTPTLGAGIVQEGTSATRMLTIVLFYVLLVTAPIAAWLLWGDPRRPLRTKIIVTVVGVSGYVLLYRAYALPA